MVPQSNEYAHSCVSRQYSRHIHRHRELQGRWWTIFPGSGATLLTADMPKIRVPAHLTDLFLVAQCNCTKPRQADHLTRLLTHYRSIFSTKCENMCRISTVEHSVLLKENTGPIRQPLHWLSPKKRPRLNFKSGIFHKGLIKPPQGVWSSSIVLVQKEYRK